MSRNGRWLCMLFAVLLAFAGLQSTPVVCALPEPVAAEEATPCITTFSTTIAVASNCTRELLGAQENGNPGCSVLRARLLQQEEPEAFPVFLCPDIFVLAEGKAADWQEKQPPDFCSREQLVIEHIQKSDGKKRTQLSRSSFGETDNDIPNKEKRREDSIWVSIFISGQSVSSPSVHGL